MKNYLLAALLAVGFLTVARAETEINTFLDTPRVATGINPLRPDPAALKRWQEMRFGMFIHWGPVSLTGQEISWSRGAQVPIEKYDNLYKEFNPTGFNADEWVAIAKAAGMKYIILTCKHHDGFCLWDTKLTDYNIMHTPFKRDVTKELAEACKKAGIAFGAYYSPVDWYNPNWPTTSPGGKVKREKYDLDAYQKYLEGQNAELIKNYGPLLTMWYDGIYPDPEAPKRSRHLIELVRSLQPDILVNGRAGGACDYDTPEQVVGSFNLQRPWESCMTVSKHNHWAWGGVEDGVKPLAACLNMLIVGAGGDGNVLLNVGPRPDGVIDPEQAGLLKKVGDWMTKYGKSIYATRGGPYKPGKWGASTRKGNTIYLHITKWIGDTLTLPPLSKKIIGSKLLTGGTVEVKQADFGVTVTVPASDHQEVDTLVELTLDGPAMEIAPIAVERANRVVGEAKASNGSSSAPLAFDGDTQTRWATLAGTHAAWIEIDFPEARRVKSATIVQDPWVVNRIEAYEFQTEVDGAWKTLCAGEKIGTQEVLKFEPVTARKFRLNITKANEGPTINEIQFKFGVLGEVKASSGLASAEMAFDHDSETRWTADAGTREGWIEIDLPEAKKVGSATVVQEPWFADRIDAYEFQAEVDGAWKTLGSGGKTGTECVLKFEPVTAQKFRLNITKANAAPVINEIELK